MMTEILVSYLKEKSKVIEKALDAYLPSIEEVPPMIHEAMRYTVLNGGKRIRPVLTLAVCDMFGGQEKDALAAACAIELIHTYSLIHDDLPCMDNADTRRGKESCHQKYGEAAALLTGDALLTHAFQILASLDEQAMSLRLVRELAQAAGTRGMIGGQVLDMQLNKTDQDLAKLDDMNQRKTGALIQMSCLAGAITAHAGFDEEERISSFGRHLGFAFQIVDDIIDGDGYLRFMSAKQAKQKAEALIKQAKEEISCFQAKNEKLCLLADAVLNRTA
ncbi:MAG: hypothetical protein COV74_04520 [Candidatus Omnitrophica bacterium CG11_big_fil_rev_8_21_14_0_20_45_26]|uniref:Polyprenyl synthetase n=1 Tax=Candidatus Abzuiibacterium crystallinum TaxID=1974748 RepID=A0A2H0LQ20_9BACT|nr:MAG: hypothetical protein COV74_04520 [Candidatus Omnitrophica bacterium CG11_big_fil_rev_8_21_14_0_20_45_26]PIW65621.1 MAG: hypothetical protein COW12_00880 [Candidatus Omnitrophica bacterium CG12_big_fil_rev_8_21_14_0_65_45_16]